jgi:hypothetical protein
MLGFHRSGSAIRMFLVTDPAERPSPQDIVRIQTLLPRAKVFRHTILDCTAYTFYHLAVLNIFYVGHTAEALLYTG